MAGLTVVPIVALDVATREGGLAIVDALGDRCGFYKIGSELFTALGPAIVREIRARGRDVFLDLKYHDIPNTVRGAVAAAAALGVRLLTVHASGGRAMLEAAREAVMQAPSGSSGRCSVLAVSVLTSLDGAALGEAWGRDAVHVEAEVLRLAALARDTGLDGLVCSALEAHAVRRELGPELELLVPGIRLAGGGSDDQTRVATPAAAAAAGADYIILGRAITRAADPRAAMSEVVAQLEAAPRVPREAE